MLAISSEEGPPTSVIMEFLVAKETFSLQEILKLIDALYDLKDNGVIGIFPEGTVNKSKDELLPFKYGAVSFASKTDSYIVPFAITGKYKLFRKSVKVKYGKPYKVKTDLEKENEILRNKILDLKGR